MKLLCEMLNVSRSSYYAWSKGESYQQKTGEQEESLALIKAFNRHRRRYGVRRLVPELQEEGFSASFHQVRKTMKKWGLKAIQPRSFIPRTTDSRDSYLIKPEPSGKAAFSFAHQ